MKCTYGKAVQWKDGNADLTGVLVLDAGFKVRHWGDTSLVLVAHGCTRELEFVDVDKLSNYPTSPIEQPIA
jgi:hypothetical protein